MINCGQFNVSQFNLNDYTIETNYSYLKITLIYFDNSKKLNNPIHTIIIKKLILINLCQQFYLVFNQI